MSLCATAGGESCTRTGEYVQEAVVLSGEKRRQGEGKLDVADPYELAVRANVHEVRGRPSAVGRREEECQLSIREREKCRRGKETHPPLLVRRRRGMPTLERVRLIPSRHPLPSTRKETSLLPGDVNAIIDDNPSCRRRPVQRDRALQRALGDRGRDRGVLLVRVVGVVHAVVVRVEGETDDWVVAHRVRRSGWLGVERDVAGGVTAGRRDVELSCTKKDGEVKEVEVEEEGTTY